MMIDGFKLWESFVGSVNTQQGGHVKPNRNFSNWVNDISAQLYEEKFSAWELNQKINDDLSRPFLKSISIEVKQLPGASYGIVPFPDNYGHFSSARLLIAIIGNSNKVTPSFDLDYYGCDGKKVDNGYPDTLDKDVLEVLELQKNKAEISPDKFKEVKIEKISNGMWSSLLEHRHNRPTLERPKITQVDEGFKVAPAGISHITLDYLRKPKDFVFGYNVVPGDPQTGEGDNIVYDVKKSEPLEWSSLVINEFLVRLEKKYGKFVREQFMYETAEMDRKTTI